MRTDIGLPERGMRGTYKGAAAMIARMAASISSCAARSRYPGVSLTPVAIVIVMTPEIRPCAARRRPVLRRCRLARLLRHQPLARERFLRARAAGLVILGVLIDIPDVVEALARQNVFRRQHRGHHGMILIV